jgi:hypothetical protein
MRAAPVVINVLTNCTSRKRREPEVRACLRDLKVQNEEMRLKAWKDRLAESAAKWTTPANDLYCGSGWTVIQAAIAKVRQVAHINLWIASAGYGLLSSEDAVTPYSATFTARQCDSVKLERDPEGNQRWWEGLTKRTPKTTRLIVSVAELARAYPTAPLLVGVSPDYLWAMRVDLVAASKALVDPDLLVIISAGAKNAGDLTPFLLPCDARLEHRLGGSRSSLNARIVAYILTKFKSGELRLSTLRRHFKNILSRSPKARTYDRKKMTDKEVEIFVRKTLCKVPGSSFSAVLRRLRDSGMACEYKRFRQMFRVIAQTITHHK